MNRLLETHDEPRGTLTQRAVWWAMFISEMVITQPDIRERIPDGASLIALPLDDQELFQHNLALAEKSKDGPKVFIQVKREHAQVNVIAPMEMSSHSYCAA